MGRPRFDESLPVLPAATAADKKAMKDAGLDPNLKLSVCAMGPVEKGDEIIAMRVWLYQQTGQKVAASAGNGGVHLGGHPKIPTEKLPFKGAKWMIQTQLEPNSPQFTKGKPALATAMALVRRGGSVEIEHWSQGVLIRP